MAVIHIASHFAEARRGVKVRMCCGVVGRSNTQWRLLGSPAMKYATCSTCRRVAGVDGKPVSWLTED